MLNTTVERVVITWLKLRASHQVVTAGDWHAHQHSPTHRLVITRLSGLSVLRMVIMAAIAAAVLSGTDSVWLSLYGWCPVLDISRDFDAVSELCC